MAQLDTGILCTDLGMTLLELRTAVYLMIGDYITTPIYWSAAEINRYINDTYVEAARDSGALHYIEAPALTSSSAAATLSNNVGRILRVTFDDLKIHNLTKYELDRCESDWENQSGDVDAYATTLHDNRAISTFKAWDGSLVYSEGLFYDGGFTYTSWLTATAYVSGDRVKAQAVAATGAYYGFVCISNHTSDSAKRPVSGADWQTYWKPLPLMVWCIKTPTELSDDTYVPELPAWCHLMVAYGAAAKALGKYGEMRNDNQRAAYTALYDDYMKLLRGHVGSKTPERLTAMSPSGAAVYKPSVLDEVIV